MEMRIYELIIVVSLYFYILYIARYVLE